VWETHDTPTMITAITSPFRCLPPWLVCWAGLLVPLSLQTFIRDIVAQGCCITTQAGETPTHCLINCAAMTMTSPQLAYRVFCSPVTQRILRVSQSCERDSRTKSSANHSLIPDNECIRICGDLGTATSLDPTAIHLGVSPICRADVNDVDGVSSTKDGTRWKRDMLTTTGSPPVMLRKF